MGAHLTALSLDSFLYVAFEGMGGGFAAWHGKYKMVKVGAHEFEVETPPSGVAWLEIINGRWTVTVYLNSDCAKRWRKDNPELMPPTPVGGTYSAYVCNDSNCPGSCAASADATCEVSYT